MNMFTRRKTETPYCPWLNGRPQLLILDEPTSELDFVACEEQLATIENIGKRVDAPTLIFVNHHIEEVLPIFSHVLLFTIFNGLMDTVE